MKIALKMFCSFLFFYGCSSNPTMNPAQLVERRASYDFNCQESRVEVAKGSDDSYAAKGCGMQAAYVIHCSVGPCVAKKVK